MLRTVFDASEWAEEGTWLTKKMLANRKVIPHQKNGVREVFMRGLRSETGHKFALTARRQLPRARLVGRSMVRYDPGGCQHFSG
jgi:hypothetical protein